jgi:hypothetical protein
VLSIELPWLENVTRASRPKRLPVVLSIAEVRSVLAQLDGTAWLLANVLYGGGLRLMEAHRLRVKDLVIERGEIIVRDAKGGKDRVTVLPLTIVPSIRENLAKLFARFERQRKLNEPGVSLPTALARKYPNAAIEWGWQWIFPVSSLCRDPYTGRPTRHHQHEKDAAAGRADRGSQGRNTAACELPYLSSLLCHAFAGGGLRHSHGTGAVGSRRRAVHHDLHACDGKRRDGSKKPVGPVAAPLHRSVSLAVPVAHRAVGWSIAPLPIAGYPVIRRLSLY